MPNPLKKHFAKYGKWYFLLAIVLLGAAVVWLFTQANNLDSITNELRGLLLRARRVPRMQ